YAHHDEPERPIDEIAAAYDALVTAGKIRAIGISNLSAERIDAWFASAETNGFAKPVALQPHYNLLTREPFESTLAPLAERHSLGVLTYFSLAAGMLTGKYTSLADIEGTDRARQLGNYATEKAFSVIKTVADVAAEAGASSTTVALAWL